MYFTILMAKKGITETQAMQRALEALEPLPKEDLPRVFSWLGSKLDMPALASASNTLSDKQLSTHAGTLSGSELPTGQNISLKAFLSQKKPKTDVERVACLAYYYTHHKGTPHYKTPDITSLNKEAAWPAFANTADAVAHATKQNKFLAAAGKGAKQITPRGEAFVEALPDREKAKQALAEYSLGSKHKKRKEKKAK